MPITLRELAESLTSADGIDHMPGETYEDMLDMPIEFCTGYGNGTQKEVLSIYTTDDKTITIDIE